MIMEQRSIIRKGDNMRRYDEYYGYILNFIEDYKNKFGESPSSREIGDALSLPKSTLSRYLSAMRKNGMLEIENARNITLAKHKPMQEIVNAPFVGKVACGLPQYAEEHIQELIPLPASYIGKGTFFVLEADGESMIDAGIDHGDLIIVRQQTTANPGDIVVALTSTTDSTATLKRYFPEPELRKIRLHPENSTMEDQYYDEVIIQGVAVRVLKNVEQ